MTHDAGLRVELKNVHETWGTWPRDGSLRVAWKGLSSERSGSMRKGRPGQYRRLPARGRRPAWERDGFVAGAFGRLSFRGSWSRCWRSWPRIALRLPRRTRGHRVARRSGQRLHPTTGTFTSTLGVSLTARRRARHRAPRLGRYWRARASADDSRARPAPVTPTVPAPVREVRFPARPAPVTAV